MSKQGLWQVWLDTRPIEDDYDIEVFDFTDEQDALRKFESLYHEPHLYRLDLKFEGEKVVTYRPTRGIPQPPKGPPPRLIREGYHPNWSNPIKETHRYG
jgi:hypothetical protein